jgi:hypothetical protein
MANQHEMSRKQVKARLKSLQEECQLTNEQVVTLAEQDLLPPSAVFVEWLILLDRGDLV